ncbi:MAG TPA: LysM peptidoglycan-binding domain-containing protein [Gemmatimonadaceae bacterium]|nr:LysM peptidoglycan-binding domain-containing protein [Gemmatimonadaceae bacterium]
MAGREQQVEQAIRAQGINVSGLRVTDAGQVISIYGSVATDDEKRRAEQAIESTVGVKVANHLTAQRTSQAAGGDVLTPSLSGAGSAAADAGGGGGQQYVVKSGDTLSKIAKHFYGDAGAWKRIYDVNREQIKNPDMIQVGQKLYIPQ